MTPRKIPTRLRRLTREEMDAAALRCAETVARAVAIPAYASASQLRADLARAARAVAVATSGEVAVSYAGSESERLAERWARQGWQDPDSVEGRS